jgi:hypothetical protein
MASVVARKVYFLIRLTLDSMSLLVFLYVGHFDQLVFIEGNFVRILRTYCVHSIVSMRHYSV